ncbi:unnamed protein product [Lymnaea stagnalis]|uniref:Prokineticin domain-containing protein n=1 Tax=Lymnaea stagnalis TaxID=6523 RepID=A0AAV2HT57_LYMST
MSSALFYVLTCLLGAVMAVPGNFCRSSAQCGRNECCATSLLIASKRADSFKSAVPVDDSARVFGGTCQTYLSEGARCSSLTNGCGCGAGLVCQQNSNIMSRQAGDQARIVAPDTGKGIFYTCTRQRFYQG